jgi:hypothetical protein
MGVVALVLLSLAGTCVAAAAAQEEQKGKARDGVTDEVSPDETIKIPVIIAYGGHGFALKEDGKEFHMLRIRIVRIRQLDPTVVRELMDEDMSIEELSGVIRDIGEKQLPIYQGYIRFVGEPYRLANISVTSAGDNFTINADVLDTLQGSELCESVGNISVTAMNYEGVMISKGELIMHGEKYQVLLDVLQQKK